MGVDLLTTGQAAARLGVDVKTLRRWERKGAITSVRTPGNHRRFRAADVDQLLALPDPEPAEAAS
jgi:excisionase family DNA binding protein